MDRDALAGEAKRLIDRISSEPRPAGSAAEARARAHCAGILRSDGFAVTEQNFIYSAFPGRLAVPLIGLLFLVWFIVVASKVEARPADAAASGLPFLMLLPALGYMLVRMLPPARLMGRRATNLVAIRGEQPSLWLVAHLDSKSQPVPMLVRIAGIIGVAVATILLVAASLAQRDAPAVPFFWLLVSTVGAIGSLAMTLSLVGDRSQGAVDNASGVAAALLTASAMPPDRSLGVLITSAEELGVQGARAWARGDSTRPGTAINFDGLDDVGSLTCMASRRSQLAKRMRLWSEQRRRRVRFRGVLPGIMVDALALGAAGWDAVTISRGNFSTLARIHTAGDSPRRLSGSGVAEAVEMVTNFLKTEE